MQRTFENPFEHISNISFKSKILDIKLEIKDLKEILRCNKSLYKYCLNISRKSQILSVKTRKLQEHFMILPSKIFSNISNKISLFY